MQRFKDLFSGHAVDYRSYRPTYPPALFAHLAKLAPMRKVAWDAGCGNGQAAVGLADHFDLVYGTDPSQAQLDNATTQAKIRYSLARAEQSGLPSATVNLTIVAQAFHWFNHDAFVKEVERVSTPGAVLCIWCYDLCSISSDVDRLMLRLYDEILGKYWESERKLVDEKYASVQMPFMPIEMPSFDMTMDWSIEDLLGYVHTWSALKSYIKDKNRDPVDLVSDDLKSAFGDKKRKVSWTLSPKAWQIP